MDEGGWLLAFGRLGTEEFVEVEAVHVPLLYHGSEVLRHLVGHHHHGGHLLIGAANGLFSFLLVLIGPVEDLVLHKLARGKGAEGSAAEVEEVFPSDGHVVVVPCAAAIHVDAAFAHHLVLFCLPPLGFAVAQVQQALGVVVPCPKMVFVQHYQVPIDAVHPLVLGFDVAVAVATQVVLEGAKHHQRLWRGERRKPFSLAAAVVSPPLEVAMPQQVFAPGVFHGRLEGEHQHPFGLHPFG